MLGRPWKLVVNLTKARQQMDTYHPLGIVVSPQLLVKIFIIEQLFNSNFRAVRLWLSGVL